MNREVPPNWYLEKRSAIEKALASGTRLDETETTVRSPSGRYSLEVVCYHIRPNCWSYSRGVVRSTATGRQIADVKRNFGHFPFSWAERHPSGHDYLLAGEDYQGQTVIELDTGARIDYIPEAAQRGVGFCWAAHYPSSDGRFLFVDGCIWAAPYELVLFDFHSPMELPYREIKRWPVWEVHGFLPDGSFVFDYTVGVRTSDGRRLDEMSADELEQFEAEPNYYRRCSERRFRVTWRPDGAEERAWNADEAE